MGEIATWSAVKTKVGLGKDSNECPTKAELLALSPTGTGENYVGLEISNASSYGNNETVKLEDIHKVTYKYSFAAVNTTLNFPALGGTSTPEFISIGSTRQKYLDGVASGSSENVSYNYDSKPDWLTVSAGTWRATENTSLSQRSANIIFTQVISGKTITVNMIQAAGVENWEYTFTSRNPTIRFPAAGGQGTQGSIDKNYYKKRFINGSLVDTQEVAFTRQQGEDWEHNVEGSGWQADENKSETSRSRTVTYKQSESNKTISVVFTQAAGVKTYGTPTVYLGTIADIPASGGTAATPTYTYTQLWGWNGKTSDGGTIDSGASVVWSENVSGSNLGTTAKARTKLGSRTLTVTLNGKSGSASVDIYQAQNRIENTTQGAWVVSISANPSTFTEQGGTSQITASARASRTNHWTSGATNAAADATGSPTLSIPPSTGFSLSGTTLTVAENTTANERSVVVRATMDTVYKEVTVTQSAYLVEYTYEFLIGIGEPSSTSITFDNLPAIGSNNPFTVKSTRQKLINGTPSGSPENVDYNPTSQPDWVITGSTSVTVCENTNPDAIRTDTITLTQDGSGKTVTIKVIQLAATLSQQWVLSEISGFGTIPAVGGQVYAIVKSGYYDVINGTQSTWHNEAPEVSNNPGWISLTSVQYNNDDTYTIKATGISNSSESGRSGKIFINNQPKSLGLDIVQSGASISYNYYFSLVSDFPSVAAAGATPMAKVLSKSKKVINGTEQSSYSIPQITVQSKPDWVGNIEAKICSHVNAEETLDITAEVSENKTSSIRRGTIIIKQNDSNKTLTLNINQSAAVIETRDFIDYVEPVPDGNFSSMEQAITVTVQSYRETIINGTVTSKVAVQPSFTLDQDSPVGWATVALIGGNPSNYEYDYEVSVSENKTISPRHGHVMFSNGTAEVENAWYFTQAEAIPTITYDLRWALSDGGSTPEDHVNEYSLGTGGDADRLHLFLLCDKISKIGTEEISRTPVQTGLSNLTTAGPVYTDINGEPSALINDDGGSNLLPALFPELKDYSNYYNIVIGSEQNLGLVQEEISMTFNKPVMDGNVEIGKVPTFLFYVDAVSYSQVMEYQFRGAGGAGAGSIYNVTVPASDGTGYFSIISFRAYLRNGVEFKREYLEPTFTAPTGVTIIKNGQNSDNSYDYALKVTDNPGEIERQWDIPFINTVTGSQIHLYLTQESPHTPEVAFDVYNSSLSASLLMGIGWRSNEGSDSLPNLSRGENLGAHGSNKSNIQVVYHAQPITTSQQWLLAAPSLKEFSYDGLPIALNGTDRYYNISEFQYGSSSASELFTVTVDNIDYDPTYGGSLTLRWEARLSNNKPTNGMYVGMIVLTPVRGNLPAIYVRLYYQSPSVKPSV